MFRNRVRDIHFVGVGGAGMSGIAEVLLNLGYRVSGSDLHDSAVTQRLVSLGARVTIGHAAANLADADVLVYSSAVRPDNPEIVAARARGVPIIPRAEMLAELMRLKIGVAVAGSHGKTTTTSLVATVLAAAGLDPTVVIGGKVNAFGSNARLGAGELLVAEADESDGSFLRLSPTIAVVTNIDPEHLDHYGDIERLRDAFVEFMNGVPFYGLAIVCADHPGTRAILPRVTRRTVTYGLDAAADYRAHDVAFHGLESTFRATRRGEDLGSFRVRMPGAHSVQNALAVLAAADELDVPMDTAREALAAFEGVQRRFTIVGEAGGVTVVDDYGHHPAEIRATLEAAHAGFGRRLVVAFQPHRYTRTRDLFDEFLGCFDRAEELIVCDVYAAGEEPIAGATAAALVLALRLRGRPGVRHVPERRDVADALRAIVRPGDMVLSLGAGDIHLAGKELVRLLTAGA